MKLVACLVVVGLALSTGATPAAAQGGATSSITGVVKDEGGGVLPGVTVVVVSNATGSKSEGITNNSGSYSVPALSAGVYTVTVSLPGFKTSIINDVRVQLGAPTTLNATLGVGALEETITVSGAGSELINTLTPAVTATMNVDQIAVIPTPTRNALNAVTFLVGINTPGGMRGSTINGLPESFLNLTLDGVSNNDTFNKNGDGFFSPVRPRQDAVEAVTVTTAVGGAELGGHGGATINFVTRSGTNRFTGSAYEYFRDKSLNSNYWFNELNGQPPSDVRLNQYGARQGGPIVRNKAFFFGHFESVRNPNDASRTRTVLNPRALDGWFRYNATVGGQQVVREVNVLDLARQNGQIGTTDPLVMRTLQSIQASTQRVGTLTQSSDPLLMEYFFLNEGYQKEDQPAIRIDYNITDRHRLTGTYNHFFESRAQDHINGADRRFADSPNYRQVRTTRPTRSLALRSTLSNNLVNELRVGITRGERLFFGRPELDAPTIATFDDTNGFALDLDPNETLGPDELTSWHITTTLSSRSGYQYTFDETLNWQKGNHSFTIGGGAFLGRAWDDSQQLVPEIDLAFDNTNDPAAGLFATANFPGASGGQLTDARQLYALLTGRVSAVTGQAALDADTGEYTYLGRRRRAGKLNVYSAFIQDSWRLSPTLTVNAGLRWDVQMPFTPSNDTMTTVSLSSICGVSGTGTGGLYNACNFFAPGASGGAVPEFVQLTAGTKGYNIDWNNFAPNIGVAWRPNLQSGWLRALLGDPDQATIRAGYAESFERQGIGGFTGVYGPNPGSTLSLTRNATTGLVQPGESWPVLLRETDRLYPASFPSRPTFPIPVRPNRADDIDAFHPDIEVASARSWQVGLQRALSSDTALEVRYVGTLGVNQWETLEYNERNFIENGFLDEFKLAMANLRANNTSGQTGRVGSFAYFGPGSGTNPLPIYLAYLNGRTDAANASAYTGNSWSNTALTQDIVSTNPSPANSATDLDGDLTRRQNAARAGLPANFFVVNPHLDEVDVRDSGAFSSYHAVQLELRRRLSKGLSLNGSYQYALEDISQFLGFHFGRTAVPSNASIRHAVKAQWDWALPFGRNERFGSNLTGVLNAIVSGWQFNGAGRFQRRTANFGSTTTNLINNGNVRLVGMTKEEAQRLYKFEVRPDPVTGQLRVFTMPDDVILNTRRAFSVSTTNPSGYSDLGVPEGRYFAPASSADCIELKDGDCAPARLVLISPWFTRFDIGVTKRVSLGGSKSLEFRADVLNVFNNINFTVTDNSRIPGSGAAIFQTDSAYRDLDNTYDPGGRLGQLAIRFNW
jgi:hypothetical protein